MKGEEELGGRFGEDEGGVEVAEVAGAVVQAVGGFGEHGDDEIFRGDGHEEDAAEDCEDSVEELEVVC